MVKLLKITRRGFLSAYCSLRNEMERNETKCSLRSKRFRAVKEQRTRNESQRLREKWSNWKSGEGVGKKGRKGVSTATGSGLFAFLGSDSWANFQSDHLYKSNDTYQYKCGGVKAYKWEEVLLAVAIRRSKTLYVAFRAIWIFWAKRLFGGEFSV